MAQIFPAWTNKIPLASALGTPVVLVGVIFGVWYWFSPAYTDAGYQPEQPVPYSHQLHVTDLGLDCRYCHNTVERGAMAAVPPTSTCMNCHTQVLRDSEPLAPIRESAETGTSMAWVRVHMLPDFVYFDHSAHLAAGVGCSTCHGRVDQMDVVRQVEPLSMRWCLDCHRDPAPNLRPLDEVTNMGWDTETAGYNPHEDPARTREVNPPLHCGGCHR